MAERRRPPIDLRASLARVEQRGIPLRAVERLQEEAGDDRRLFTSDLSVSEFLLASDAGCQPIAQVMGSSIYHVAEVPDYKGKDAETIVKVISDAHREVRRAALYRLYQEAALVGADAVVGVHAKERAITMGKQGKGGDDGGEILEFTMVGTAVKAPWITHAPGQPIVTDLSGQELWALKQDGFEPCGFVFEFCRNHVWHVTGQNASMTGELRDASNAVEKARETAQQMLLQQAAEYQAEFVIGSDLKVEVREVACGYAGCELDDLDVEVSMLGTAVRRIPGTRAVAHEVPPLILSMIPLGRRKDALLDVEDDADEIEIAAEEAQEAALEADEAAGES